LDKILFTEVGESKKEKFVKRFHFILSIGLTFATTEFKAYISAALNFSRTPEFFYPIKAQ
jgi:hypothetical protein